MVLGYHVAFGAYGFWLPNDPRGSWSEWIRSLELLHHGPATGPDRFWSIESSSKRTAERRAAKRSLRYPPVLFNNRQIVAIAQGLARVIDKCGYAVWACGIMRDHVHMVIRRHHYKVERMVGLLKQGATTELAALGLHPMSEYGGADGSLLSPWERNCWKTYLNTHDQIELAIEYVEENPRRAGLGRQSWPSSCLLNSSCNGRLVTRVFDPPLNGAA